MTFHVSAASVVLISFMFESFTATTDMVTVGSQANKELIDSIQIKVCYTTGNLHITPFSAPRSVPSLLYKWNAEVSEGPQMGGEHLQLACGYAVW